MAYNIDDPLITVNEFEFISYLSTLLSNNPKYTNVTTDYKVPHIHYIVDIFAKNTTDNSIILIDCKAKLFDIRQDTSASKKITTHIMSLLKYKLIFAVPHKVNTFLLNHYRKQGIEIWDATYISTNFKEQILSLQDTETRNIIRIDEKYDTLSNSLIAELTNCPPGKEACLQYQRLVGKILEYLFLPELKAPLTELSDETGTNRRDFILPNYCEQGFWSFIRHQYKADYIVVDAKNYSKKVGKTCILQIGNYLKEHGCGCFGLIVSRDGFDKGAKQTAREQWALHRKLIISISDESTISMLTLKASSQKPTDVLGELIQTFRLSF